MWLLAAQGVSGRLLAASWPFDGVSGRAAADFVLGTLLFYRMAQVGALTRKFWVTSSCWCKKAEGRRQHLFQGVLGASANLPPKIFGHLLPKSLELLRAIVMPHRV